MENQKGHTVLEIIAIVLITIFLILLGLAYAMPREEEHESIVETPIEYPPCKLSVEILPTKTNKYERVLKEFLLDGKFCDDMGYYNSQHTFMQPDSVFFEIYSLPWSSSANFADEESFNLKKYD